MATDKRSKGLDVDSLRNEVAGFQRNFQVSTMFLPTGMEFLGKVVVYRYNSGMNTTMSNHSYDIPSESMEMRPEGVLFMDYRPLDPEGWKRGLANANDTRLRQMLSSYEAKNKPRGLGALFSGESFRRSYEAERQKIKGMQDRSEASLKTGLDGLLKTFPYQPVILSGDSEATNNERLLRKGKADFIIVGEKRVLDTVVDGLMGNQLSAPAFLRQLFDPAKCVVNHMFYDHPDFDKDPFKFTRQAFLRDYRRNTDYHALAARAQ